MPLRALWCFVAGFLLQIYAGPAFAAEKPCDLAADVVAELNGKLPKVLKDIIEPESLDDVLKDNYYFPWTRRLLGSLLKPLVDRNAISIFQFKKPKNPFLRARLFAFSSVTIPVEFAKNLVRIFKAKGLTVAERFVIFPFRLFSATVSANLVSTVLYIASVTGGHTVLGAIGVAVPSPLHTATDVSKLGGGEVIVIVKYYAKDKGIGIGSQAAEFDSATIAALEKDFPSQILVLDLEKMKGEGDLDHRIEEFVRSRLANRSVRNLIFASHGGPATIFSSGELAAADSSISLPDLARHMRSLSGRMSADADIHFEGCNISAGFADDGGASRLETRASLQDFGAKMLPLGGRVHASNIAGSTWRSSRVRPFTYLLGPTKFEAMVAIAGIVASSRDGYEGGPLIGEPIEYVIKVPVP